MQEGKVLLREDVVNGTEMQHPADSEHELEKKPGATFVAPGFPSFFPSSRTRS
jgi:hypothetical protein